MDYREIDQIMTAKRLSDNPAFGDELAISLESIACTNSCPLGLYFPVSEWSPNVQRYVRGETIILPPDACEGALFHELGHRHGHYYYDNLSEKYAEDFRRKYQKGRALLYLGNDLSLLPKFGKLFEEGERGAVELALSQKLTPAELYNVEDTLYSYSRNDEPAPVVHYGNSAPWLRVEFTTGADFMVIIGSLMAATVLATVGALGYAVYKISDELPWIVPLTIFGALSTMLLLPAMRKARARIPEVVR